MHVRHLPLKQLDYLVYRYAAISKSGVVSPVNDYADITHLYPDVDFDTHEFVGSFGELLKLKKSHKNLKTIVAIGGWEQSEIYPKLASNETARKRFALSTLEFVTRYGFDGVEVDWQLPRPSSSGINQAAEQPGHLIAIMNELKQAFINSNKKLTIFVNLPQHWLLHDWPVDKLASTVDFISLGTGYINGYWHLQTRHMAPMVSTDETPSVRGLTNLLLDRGVQPGKIIINISPFGTGWQGVPKENNGLYQTAQQVSWGSWDSKASGATGLYSREYLTHLLNREGYLTLWDDVAEVPYLYNPDRLNGHFISYENNRSIATKVKFAKDNKLAGIGIRQLHNDLRNQKSVVNNVYSNFFPLKSARLSWQYYYGENRSKITLVMQVLSIILLFGVSGLLYQRRMRLRQEEEEKKYISIRDNLQALSEPLFRLYQLAEKNQKTSNKYKIVDLKNISPAAAELLRPITKLISETTLHNSERNTVLEPISAYFLLQNIRELLESEQENKIDITIHHTTECTLKSDLLFLIRIIQELSLILINNFRLNSLSIESKVIDRRYFQLLISAKEPNQIIDWSKSFYRLKDIYPKAKKIGVSVKQIDSGFEIDIPIIESTLGLQTLEWIQKPSIDTRSASNQPPQLDSLGQDAEDTSNQSDKVTPTSISSGADEQLTKLAKFNNANFSTRDAAGLIEQACEFFSISLNQELQVSVYQGEQLIAKIGEFNNKEGTSIDFRSGEYKFVIESEGEISNEDQQFFGILVGQVQMVRRALKTLAKEPTLLSELSELAANKDKIAYLKADAGYTAIYLQGIKDPRYISMRLRNIKQYFDDDGLLQIHRSYLVNPKRVTKVVQTGKMKYEIHLDGIKIPVSRTYIPRLKETHPEWTESL